MDRLLAWPRAGLRALTQTLIGLRPAVRRLVPRRLHHATGEAVRWLIRRAEGSDEAGRGIERFAMAANPLLPPQAFAAGPILHANAALAWGGAERQLVNLLKAQQARLDRPSGLLCLRLGESAEFDFFRPELAAAALPPRNAMDGAAAAATLDRLGGSSFRTALLDALAWAPPDVAADVIRFAAELAEQRPRVVHGWQDGVGPAAALAALAVGVPRILVSGRNVRPANFSYYRPSMLTAYRLLAREPRVILCNNSEAGARDYAAWLGIEPSRIRVVRNGIAPDRVRRIGGAEVDGLRRSLGVPQGGCLIGSLFRLYPEKRPLLWVRAAEAIARRLPNAHFALFGEGAMERHVQREAERRGVAGRLRLMPPTHNLSLTLSAFDVFMLTSQYEGTPNVVLEAALAGVPTVAMDAGAVAETIAEGETGYVVADGPALDDGARAEAIADRVAAIMADGPWRRRVLEAGPQLVRSRYGMDRMIDETIALYGLEDDLSAPA